MTTTLGQFADALGALAIVGAREHGCRLYQAGQSYECCTTDAERDGWIAAWNEAMEDQEVMEEITVADNDPLAGKETHGICETCAAKLRPTIADHRNLAAKAEELLRK